MNNLNGNHKYLNVQAMKNINNQAKFITFEGLDFSGKSSLARLIASKLSADGKSYIITREPGGCEIAETLRSLVLSMSTDISAMSELLLFFAARIEHLRKTVYPALREGKVVICDRFLGSSFIYQGLGKHLGVNVVDDLYKLTLARNPQFKIVENTVQTFILDITYETMVERFNIRGELANRLDVVDEDAFNILRKAYRNLPQYCNFFNTGDNQFHIIDASGSLEEIANEICLKAGI
jgi:dTMP kinase